MSDARNKVFEVIAESLQISLDRVNEDLAVGSIPEWDSLAHVKLILEIENAFEMQIDMEALMDLEDVGDLLEIVEKSKSHVPVGL